MKASGCRSFGWPLVVVLLSAVTLVAQAECHLPLALAAGSYLKQLEKLHLQKYQNSSVCEVLSYEFWSCSAEQKAQLEKSFAVKEVLGNYCMPHLPPPPNRSGPNEFIKGAELFSWKDEQGYFWYALLPGTNRQKTTKEIQAAKMSEGYFRSMIATLPEGIPLAWNSVSTVDAAGGLPFNLPPAATLSEFKEKLSRRKIQWTSNPPSN